MYIISSRTSSISSLKNKVLSMFPDFVDNLKRFSKGDI